jgi:hypothetical protein
MVHRNRAALLIALVSAGLLRAAPASAQCSQLTPSRISTRYVSIGSTSLDLAFGMIGVQPTVTGPALFYNLNQGDRTGIIRLLFTGSAPASGTAKVTDKPLRIKGSYSLSGDFFYQAPDGRPDSSLDVSAFAAVTIGASLPKTLAFKSLLSRWTYGPGESDQLDNIQLPLPTASFRVRQGEPIVYAMALEIDSYSSARGAVGVTVTEFGRLENDIRFITMCVTPDP